VWADFGYNFGKDFLAKVLAGEEVATALWKTRQEYLACCHNPFGLVYSYYGGLQTRLIVSTP
jgi:hypothetical protein